jgi:cytidylate kinase
LNTTEQLLDILKRKVLQFDISGGVMKVSIDGIDVSEEIREPSVTANVRYIAEKPELRKELVQMQRDFARQHGGIVTEGRDQGTEVFPDADFKFFLTAGAEERARRRQAQLGESGKEADLEELRENIEKRDASDKNRAVGPLTPADDAIVIDTTNMQAHQAVEKVAEYIK